METLAENASFQSNCNKKQVGACLRIIKHGKDFCFLSGMNKHKLNSCECVPNLHDPIVEHAEIVAIKDLSNSSKQRRLSHGLELILYVTYQPCLKCSIEIVKKGIHKVYFRDPKPEDQTGIEYLIKNKVKVVNKWN